MCVLTYTGNTYIQSVGFARISDVHIFQVYNYWCLLKANVVIVIAHRFEQTLHQDY